MTATPHDFLSIAEELLKGTEEIHLRCAASRAYYAAYHSSLPFHKKLPAGGSRGSTHAKVIQDYSNFLGDPPELRLTVRKIGILLNQAKSVREIADYELGQNFPRKQAEYAIGLVKRIHQELRDVSI